MSLMGSRGRRASLSDAPQSVQWTHSVQAELDYVGLARAQLLGLSRQHEVIFEGLDVDLTWDLDPRIQEEEECYSHEPMENSPRQQPERSVPLWAGTVEAHCDCAAEEPSFQAPSLRMGIADEVEPDAGGFFAASHGELAVSVPSKGTFVQPLCTVPAVSSLHACRHPIPLQAAFDEASETVYHNRWVRGLANCFSQLDVSLPTLSQPVHRVGSTATSILAASLQASTGRCEGTLPLAEPAASEVSVPLSQPVHVWRSTAPTTGPQRPHPALCDPSWVLDGTDTAGCCGIFCGGTDPGGSSQLPRRRLQYAACPRRSN